MSDSLVNSILTLLVPFSFILLFFFFKDIAVHFILFKFILGLGLGLYFSLIFIFHFCPIESYAVSYYPPFQGSIWSCPLPQAVEVVANKQTNKQKNMKKYLRR